MRVEAGKIDPKDFGSRVTVKGSGGTTSSRVLTGVAHSLKEFKLNERVGMTLKASFMVTTLHFADLTQLVVPSTEEIELDPETEIRVEVYYPNKTGLR